MNKIEFLANIDKYKGEDHSTFLKHYGILGQKWGQRRWQNSDGTFNEEGKKRYFGQSLNKKDAKKLVDDVKKENPEVSSKKLQKLVGEKVNEEKIGHLWESDYVKKQAKAMYKNNEITKEQYKIMLDAAKNIRKTEEKQLEEAEKLEKSIMDGKKISWSKVGELVESEKCDNIRKDYDEAFKNIYQDQQNKLNELFEDYNKESYAYRAKSGILNYLYDPLFGDSIGDLANNIRLYTWDDLDQGCNSSQYVYLQDKGYNDKQIQEMSKKDQAKFDEMKEISRQLVEQDPVLCLMSDKAKEEIADKINWNKMIGNNNRGHWYLNDADEGTGYDKGEHRDEMNKIYNKLSKAGNEDYGNGWWNLSKAIYNLNLSDKKYTELTDADWKAINAEVRELNKLGSNQKIGSWTEADQAKHMEDFRNWQEVGKKVKMPGGDVRVIYDSDEEYYDDDAKRIILKNADLIHKMDKALSKGDSNKYMKLRNSNFEDDYEKDLVEEFIRDKRILDEYNNTINDLNKLSKKKGIKVNVESYDDIDMNLDGESNGRRAAFETDFIKHPENIKKYKENCEKVLNNYDKFNEELIDKLSDKYYNAYKNTWGYETHPLTKEQFKKTFEKATGTLYPASNGNGATFEGEISYNPYEGPLKNYLFFDYDLLNKTFGYIDEE